ncbi:MAG: helix-turn-helix domain-containing protein [Granulosicoccus sp.]|nr:helix-turn-helix domain-containing protein [Granulosicoccus sp.]
MDLQTYIKSFPRNQRAMVRAKLADAHGVSEVTVRAWANSTRRHPYTLAALKITEDVTGGIVTRYDLRPEIFGSEQQQAQMDR